MQIDPGKITNVVLSHAHIDHSGRIPLLIKNGFAGRIVCTRATADACEYLLLDAAHIQESDAAYLNYKTIRSHLSGSKKTGSGKKRHDRDDRDIKKMLKKNHHQIDVEMVGLPASSIRPATSWDRPSASFGRAQTAEPTRYVTRVTSGVLKNRLSKIRKPNLMPKIATWT
jgi:metallo-beta-lactamase family protein